MSPIDSPRESCSSSPRRTTGVAAELGDADLEGDPRPRRGPLEDERDAAPGQRLGADPLAAGRPSAPAPGRAACRSSNAPQLFAGEEVPLQAADTTAGGVHARSPGTSSTGATSRPTRSLLTWRSRLLRIDERNETHVQVNRDLLDEFATRARRRRVGRRPAAGVPAALRGAASPRPARAERAPGAHLAQLARPAARPARPPQPRPDRLRRGRLEPDPGPRRGRLGGIVERRELAIHEGAPERRTMAFDPHRLRRSASPTCTPPTTAPSWPTADVLRAAGRRDRVGRRARRCSSAATSTCARPRTPSVFERAARALRPRGPTAPRAIDHLLARGLEVAEPPPPGRRSGASCRSRAGRCGSPTTPRSKRGSARDPSRWN